MLSAESSRQAALLVHKKLTKDSMGVGFELNLCDPCVANKMINGKQMMLCWQVEAMKISHCDTTKVNDMIKWPHKMHGHLFEDGSGSMETCCGKIHAHIGMTLDFNAPGQVKVTMLPCVKEIVDNFAWQSGDAMMAVAPAAEHLFEIDNDANKLTEEMGKLFHNFVAKCLFVTRRARPDVHATITFLSTRVRQPDKDEWKKLQQMTPHPTGLLEPPLILSAN
jgi:hypothetical protein